ncbi:hypothetical protein J2T07_003766 [Luteibacter jiangsuensis]|uniref:Uncharacterized protein n=1 Tax=Luteibacter jiangsuensis TaxID=637577 RepID=A0ABT9T2S8_9GAMM|nr:hypothetical protein [Luteibacter jiangsuensis]MDQ0011552.1 hypothetical protein [Luteibacter jiangsuensis]
MPGYDTPRADGRARHYIDPEASAHDLLNDATEWLQYARGLTGFLADLVHESDSVDCARLALSLEAIGGLMHMGVQCTAHAHARMSWEQARDANHFNAASACMEAE